MEGYYILNISNFLRETLQIENPALICEMLAMCKIDLIKKGKQLIRQGQQVDSVYFLVEGICRGFFSDINGKDITDCLVTQSGLPLIAATDFKAPAPISIQVLVDSRVLRISTANFESLLSRFPDASAIYQNILIWYGNFHRELKIMAYQYDTNQRYHWFLEKYPTVIDKISHKYIASFLNMSPVTLSRLIHTSDSQ